MSVPVTLVLFRVHLKLIGGGGWGSMMKLVWLWVFPSGACHLVLLDTLSR